MELSEQMMDDWRRKKAWNWEENPCLKTKLIEIKNKINRKGGRLGMCREERELGQKDHFWGDNCAVWVKFLIASKSNAAPVSEFLVTLF